MLRIIIAILLFITVPAQAQFVGNGVTQAQLDAVASTVPTPLASVPPGPSGAGVIGTGGQYIPWNGQQRQAVQRTVANTDASGNFSVTWATSFVSSTPTVTVTAGNPAGSQPIVCNWQTRSATGVTGKCWLSNTTLLNLSIVTTGLTLNNFTNPPASNTPISVIMAEPTQ